MAELDIEALRGWIAAATIAIVVAERPGPREPFEAYSLDVDQGITADFRDRALNTLADYAAGLLHVQFEDNTQLADHELGIAERDVLDPALVAELTRAAQNQPQRDHEAHPDQLRLSAVAAVGRDHTALLLRAQNPGRHLSRDHLTLRFLNGRLTRADPLFVYDAAFDVIVFDDAVAIRSQTALESMFMDPERRVRDTDSALSAVAPFVRVTDHGALEAAADSDARYAGKLRRMFRSGVFETVDLAAIAQTIEDFNLALRVVEGHLAFPRTRSGRWEFVYALEVAFVFGRATGRPYQAPSKGPWMRRSVEEVTPRRKRPCRSNPGVGSAYMEILREDAEWVRSFRIQSDSVCALFFATNHPLGLTKWKEATWAVDPVGGTTFSDATAPGQEVFFADANVSGAIEALLRSRAGW